MPSFFGGFTALGLRLIFPASFRCSLIPRLFTGLHASASGAYSRPCSATGKIRTASSAFRTKYRAKTQVYMPSDVFSQHTVSRKMKAEKSLVSQRFEALFTNSFCPITQIKRQLPAPADSCLVCKTRMDSYLRFITSLTFSMMWRPMSLEASTVCAPMWGLMTKLSQEKSGLWNSSLPLRPLPASSFSMTSAA